MNVNYYYIMMSHLLWSLVLSFIFKQSMKKEARSRSLEEL
jgi:hypothetical protein